jgi:hypothetical protein
MSDLDEVQSCIDRKIASAAVAYMSDAKWRKLFNALGSYTGQVPRLRLKFVDDERLFPTHGIPGPFGDGDTSFRDEMPAPYAPFREIDFLFIPKIYKNLNSEPNKLLPDLCYDLSKLISHLESIAKFPIQICGLFWVLDEKCIERYKMIHE